MSSPLEAPDPNTVSHEAAAQVAQQAAAEQLQKVILRDAKILEYRQYTAALEARVAELESKLTPAPAAPKPA